MSTFEEYKEDMKLHSASIKKINGTTSTDDIYWKLLYSGSAYTHKIQNYPSTEEHKKNLINLSKVLSALAQSSGFTIYINSGYRNVQVNGKVGGASTSQHMNGEAADMDCESMSVVDNAKLFLYIINSPLWKNKFDQIIWERPGSSLWVHCSFKVNGSDISKDSSYNPRSYNSGTKVYWYNGKTYTNIWTSKYKREENGNVYFVSVDGLNGVKYNGTDFEVDYSKITEPSGSISGGYGINSNGIPSSPTYGSSNGEANKVKNLSKSRNRKKGTEPNLDETRKQHFDSLANTLINEAPGMGRNIIKSQEMYDTSLLKGDQLSKKRISKKNKTISE